MFSAEFALDDENEWQLTKRKTVEYETKNTNYEKMLLDLEKLQAYLTSFNARTFNDINNITTMANIKTNDKRTIELKVPVDVVQFKDLDKNTMCRTAKYIELYTAIKNGDIHTIRNLTTLANKNEALHLCVLDQHNTSPIHIALVYCPELVPEIKNIMESQTIKPKEKKKKARSRNAK